MINRRNLTLDHGFATNSGRCKLYAWALKQITTAGGGFDLTGPTAQKERDRLLSAHEGCCWMCSKPLQEIKKELKKLAYF